MTKVPVYAWDSSVFIAWLTDDQTAPLNDIDAVIAEIDQNDVKPGKEKKSPRKAKLLVSVVAYTEVLAVKHTPEQMDRFQRFLKRENVMVVDTNIIVAEKAAQIRNRSLQAGRKISTPDATHAAVAILFKADVLHALDQDLLVMNGTDAVDGLKITLPQLSTGQIIMLPPPST